jgi:molybdate transport repressor ModE-like protein
MALLRAVDAEGSIRAAARTVKWSYRHALMYLDNAEATLRQQLVERARGGSEQGGAELTPRGRALVQRYTRFRREMDKALQRLSRAVMHETGG